LTFEEWWKDYEAKYGEKVYEVGQAETAEMAWKAGIDQWVRSCRITAAQGHNDLCEFCGKPCDGFAGNPALWPLIFTHPDGTGIAKAHHTGCVQKKLFNL
jgi:hypothetical protein